MASEKKYYRICSQTGGYIGECNNEGYMLLTKEEAEIVHKATNIINWVHLEAESSSTGLSIDIHHPMTKEEMEADYEESYGWSKQDRRYRYSM